MACAWKTRREASSDPDNEIGVATIPCSNSMCWFLVEVLRKDPLEVWELLCHVPGARGAKRHSDGLSKRFVRYSHVKARDVCLMCRGHSRDCDSFLRRSDCRVGQPLLLMLRYGRRASSGVISFKQVANAMTSAQKMCT